MKNVTKVSLSIAALTLGACSGMTTKNQTPEEAVVERAQARYDALMKKDQKGLEEALSYTTKSFRDITSAAEYQGRYGGRAGWESADVQKAMCDESVCEVSIKVVFKTHRINVPLNTYIDEKWIEVDGEWWVYHK